MKQKSNILLPAPRKTIFGSSLNNFKERIHLGPFIFVAQDLFNNMCQSML
jgi:hypothetical protein